MSNIKQHVVSLEMAIKLKKAGWDKPTRFYWYEGLLMDNLHGYDLKPSKRLYFSPLATEILEELPTHIVLDGDKGAAYIEVVRSDDNTYRIDFSSAYKSISDIVPYTEDPHNFYPTLADALAHMWLYLESEGHLST